MGKYELHISTIPKSMWKKNVRTNVTKSDWDKIRKEVYERANMKCEICDEECKTLHAHEVWDYDEINEIQRLEDIIGICEACHNTIHYGRAQMIGTDKQAKEHFMKVNNCDEFEWQMEVTMGYFDHVRRSKITNWKLDLSYIENMGYKTNSK